MKFKDFFFKLFCIAGCFLLLSFSVNNGRQPSAEYKLKAVFLYNFTRFIEWPESAFFGPDAPFIIGILGDDPFGEALTQAVSGEFVGSHHIIIKHFDKDDKFNCQILFINSDDPELLRYVINQTKDTNTLTVNESPNFSRLGGHIKFYTEMQKIKLEINTSSIKESQLTVSSKLLNVAHLF